MARVEKNPAVLEHIPPKTRKILREFPDVGIRVIRRKNKPPVVYLWQAFATIRLTEQQVRAISKAMRPV